MLIAKDVVDYLIVLAHGEGRELTLEQAEELCYRAQGISLVLLDRPLFDDEIIATTII